jgi:SHS2 domain-containing protein
VESVEYLISPGPFGSPVRFEEIDHTADVGIRAYGATPSEIFESAATGMFSLIANLEKVKPVGEEEIRLSAEDLPGLLIAFLSELLFLHETQHLLFAKFEVEVRGSQLHARAWGEAIDKQRHELKLAIKAVTYHRLSVDPEKGVAEVIFDA